MTDLSFLNEQQKHAVLESALHNIVLLAGAGAGKTKTLVTRAQYLIDDLNVDPSNIMMVTFTNKAATEIASRMFKINPKASEMWIGTFHRICTRIMRLQGKPLGINNFTIMDTKESKALVKECLDNLGLDSSPYVVSSVVSKISYYKNNLKRPAQVLMDKNENQIYAQAYQEYQNVAWKRKTFDFDDLIIYTILLLSSFPEIAEWAHSKFKYVMADECQDTNAAQFILLKLIAGENNVMLVGDQNQSIYAFRNANPRYLMDFASTTPNTEVLRLEQNYRSTKTIINAANSVIAHNNFGAKINMFTANDEGEKIKTFECNDPYEEAKWVSSEILFRSDKKFEDFAIIYRANYQSRVIEEELNKNGIPYTIFGALSFYGRKEVKDLLAWLKLYSNPSDVVSFKRVASTFKGVGEAKIAKVTTYAEENGVDYIKALVDVTNSDKRVSELVPMALVLNTKHDTCFDIIQSVIDDTSYRSDIAVLCTEDSAERLDIIDEFLAMLDNMANEKKLSMEETIDQIALLSETKGEEKQNLNAVKLMTAHASKGLEFDTVFIVGAEEGTFPHSNSLAEHSAEAIEEERRLFYVAMTRAEKELYITNSRMRKQNLSSVAQYTLKSRFVNEIPKCFTVEAF